MVHFTNGTTVWVTYDGVTSTLYAYTLATGARDTTNDITLTGANRQFAGRVYRLVCTHYGLSTVD